MKASVESAAGGICLYPDFGFLLLNVCEIRPGFSTSYPQEDVINMARKLHAIAYPGCKENSSRVGDLVL